MTETTPSERWLPIPGYEGFYEASDLGRIRTLPRSFRKSAVRVLKPAVMPAGHLQVALSVNGQQKSFCVHRLVAITFLGAPPPGHEVCHDDGNPANNVLSNLRWGTRGDNIRDSVRHGTNAWASRTHCPQGHAYDEENTGFTRRGDKTQRYCRACKHEIQRRYHRRRRGEPSRENTAALERRPCICTCMRTFARLRLALCPGSLTCSIRYTPAARTSRPCSPRWASPHPVEGSRSVPT